MKESKKMNTTRRSFFLRGSAAVGAGLATASAGATTLLFDDSLPLKEQVKKLQQRLNTLEDREAIYQLQLACSTLMGNGDIAEAAGLFTTDGEVIVNGEAFQVTSINREIYTAFHPEPDREQDKFDVSEDRQQAYAVFRCQAEISQQFSADTAVEAMAKQQGMVASRRHVKGNFEMACRRENGGWKISRLEFIS